MLLSFSSFTWVAGLQAGGGACGWLRTGQGDTGRPPRFHTSQLPNYRQQPHQAGQAHPKDPGSSQATSTDPSPTREASLTRNTESLKTLNLCCLQEFTCTRSSNVQVLKAVVMQTPSGIPTPAAALHPEPCSPVGASEGAAPEASEIPRGPQGPASQRP